jgi:hypothetical protein
VDRTRARLRVAGAVAAVAALTAAAATLRFWGLRFGLPDAMARPDEEAITTIASRFVLIGPNPNFFDYPTLFTYAVAFVERLWPGGQAVLDDTLPRLISRSIAAGLGTASVPLVFLIGRRLFSMRAGLLASGFLAVAFLHVRDSHFGVTDVPMTFMVVLALFVIVAMPEDRASPWTIGLAAVLCGLAASTKYNAALIVAPLVVAALQRSARPWMYAMIAVGFAAGFLAGTPYALIARQKFLADLLGLQSHLSSGHAVDEGLGWVHHLTFSLRYGLGLPLLLTSLAGAVWLVVAERRIAWVLLAFPVLYYAGMGSGRTVFMRHMTPIVPFAVIVAAFALDRAAVFVGARLKPRAPYSEMTDGMSTALVTILAIAIAYDSAQRSVALDRLLAEPDSRTVAAAFMKASYFPKGVTVFQNGSVYGQVPLVPEGIYPTMPPERLPEVVILQSSRLVAYSTQPAGLRDILAAHYRPLMHVPVERPDGPPEPVFDQQDAFYAPVAGFHHFLRPGPEIEIFVRSDR